MEQSTVDAFFSELGAIYKEAGAPPLPGTMEHALFSGMKSSPGAKVSPGYAKAPSPRGLAGSGTPSMPMPKVQANPIQNQVKVGGAAFAPSVQPRLPRQMNFTPAPVGTRGAAPAQAVKKPAPPGGSLNPGGGFY